MWRIIRSVVMDTSCFWSGNKCDWNMFGLSVSRHLNSSISSCICLFVFCQKETNGKIICFKNKLFYLKCCVKEKMFSEWLCLQTAHLSSYSEIPRPHCPMRIPKLACRLLVSWLTVHNFRWSVQSSQTLEKNFSDCWIFGVYNCGEIFFKLIN